MGYLSKEQAKRLLGEPIISFLTTINSDGSPHTSPVWHLLNEDNSHIWVATSKTTVKARNVRMDQESLSFLQQTAFLSLGFKLMELLP